MTALQPNTHSFIVKVWYEPPANGQEMTALRGQITHVPSGERRYFTDLAEIPPLIAPYLQQLGLKPTWWRRVRAWLLRARADL